MSFHAQPFSLDYSPGFPGALKPPPPIPIHGRFGRDSQHGGDFVFLPSSGKLHVLLIGLDGIGGNEHLFQNPVRDARSLAAELQNSCIAGQTTVLANPKRAEILGALAELAKKNYEPGDRVLVFFAGPALFDLERQQGFLLALDSFAGRVATYLPVDEFTEAVDRIPARSILLLVDAPFGVRSGRLVPRDSSR